MATTPTEDPDLTVVEVVGRFVDSSNATLLGRLATGRPVVYKPVQGETPLWDFPPGTLGIREVLAHRVSEAAGFGVVPTTGWGDGPFGPGSVQHYLETDDTADPRHLIVPEPHASIWPIAALDVLTNAADRKLGHILTDTSGRTWAIDNALTFHPEDKLRSVLWSLAGLPVPDPVLAGVARLRGHPVTNEIADLLGGAEAEAFATRVERLLEYPVHPDPPTDRPPMPWPIW